MANMSYCRFNNTLIDLEDCFDAIENDLDDTSEEELRKCKRMLQRIADFFEDNGVDIDRDAFNEWIEEIEKYMEVV